MYTKKGKKTIIEKYVMPLFKTAAIAFKKDEAAVLDIGNDFH